MGWLAWDPAGCVLLEDGGDPWQKPLRKSALMTSARTALRQVGLATGLEHSEPAQAKKRRGRPPDTAVDTVPSNGAPVPTGPEPAPTATTPRTGYAWSRPVQANQSHSDANGKEVR